MATVDPPPPYPAASIYPQINQPNRVGNSLEAKADDEVNPKTGKPIRSFEDVLELVKPIGWWQAWIFILISYIQFWCAAMNLAVVFYGITPDYRCDLGEAEKRNNWTFAEKKLLGSPYSTPKTVDACQKRRLDLGALKGKSFEDIKETVYLDGFPNTTECTKFVYDNTVDMELTIVNQWDLVCDQKFRVEDSQLVYMLGFLIGSFISGQISDFFGRKPTYVVFLTLVAILGSAQGLTPTYDGFLALRFFVAIVVIGQTMASFCLALEVTSTKHRIFVGSLFWIPYGLGYACLSLFAMALPDWRYLHLAVAAPNILGILFIWLLPESPRWLMIKGKTAEAKKTLQWAAKWNGKKLPATLNFEKIAASIRKDVPLFQESAEKRNTVHIIHICCYPRLLFRALNLFFNWMVIAAVYYGISLNVTYSGGNRYVNNAVAGLIEIPSSILMVPLIFWSRKKSLVLTLLISGALLIGIPWLPTEPSELKSALPLLAKLSVTIAFGIVYVLPLELFPTLVRNSALSTSSCFGRLGSMAAPYIVGGIRKSLGEDKSWVAFVILACASFMAGLLALFLPESKGKKLPDTFEEAKNLQDDTTGKKGSVYPKTLEMNAIG